jgi:hypothetical protein
LRKRAPGLKRRIIEGIFAILIIFVIIFAAYQCRTYSTYRHFANDASTRICYSGEYGDIEIIPKGSSDFTLKGKSNRNWDDVRNNKDFGDETRIVIVEPEKINKLVDYMWQQGFFTAPKFTDFPFWISYHGRPISLQLISGSKRFTRYLYSYVWLSAFDSPEEKLLDLYYENFDEEKWMFTRIDALIKQMHRFDKDRMDEMRTILNDYTGEHSGIWDDEEPDFVRASVHFWRNFWEKHRNHVVWNAVKHHYVLPGEHRDWP